MKYLGIDFGTKKVGIAVSDEGGKVAFPRNILENTSELFDVILKFIKEEDIQAVVLGESKDYHGEDNAVMEYVRKFAKKIEDETALKVYFEAETLSTKEAKRSGITSDRDAAAATIILQSFLDKQR